MVLEVSSLTAPLDLFGPAWPCHKPATTEDDIGYAHHPRLQPAVAKHAAKERPIKRVKSDSEAAPCASPPLRGTSPSSRVRPLTASPTLVKAPEPCQLSPPATPLPTAPAAYKHQDDGVATPTFSFTQILAPASGTFSFPSIVLAIRTDVVKRARPRSDVDGEHTAALSSKKRRLRLQLITSRLSRPYCSPASHILNRDAIVSGEKRFLKLASNAEAARRLPSVQSSLLHRAAVLNRVRLRVRSEVMERGGGIAVAGVPANAALLYQGLSHFTGARFVVSQSGLEGSIASQLAQQKKSTPKPRVPSACPVPPPIVTKSRPSPSPPGTPSMRAVDPRTRAATAPQAPRLRPLSSPELGPHRAPVIDDEHDEESAFPTSEHESRYESSDDPEEVYSDFSLIFGNPGDEIEEEEEYDEHSYEEYLEELDGIPWLGL